MRTCKTCKGTRRLDCRVIDGTPGWVTCPWCPEVKNNDGDR